jgi:hypothetical protein
MYQNSPPWWDVAWSTLAFSYHRAVAIRHLSGRECHCILAGGHFNKDGTPDTVAQPKTCFPCHAKASRDLVFTRLPTLIRAEKSNGTRRRRSALDWVFVSMPNVRALTDARFAEGERVQGVLRASGKAVWTWPRVVAADAGPMQIQLGKGRGLRCSEAALRSMALRGDTAKAAWSQKSVAKMVVEEAGEEIGVAGR